MTELYRGLDGENVYRHKYEDQSEGADGEKKTGDKDDSEKSLEELGDMIKHSDDYADGHWKWKDNDNHEIEETALGID